MAKPEPSLFDEMEAFDPEADARRMAVAEADVAAGRTVSNSRVMAWLKTWGTGSRAPAPLSWRK
jgi:predicted transcriptional regulator